MTTKAAAVLTVEDQIAPYADVIAAATKELSDIRKANKALDAEIRRLQKSTRKSLDQIQENLRHVEAVR
jgi:cell division protein FtsB